MMQNYKPTEVKVRNISKNLLPTYETPQSSGMDLRADFSRVTPEKPLKLFGDGELIFPGDTHKKVMIRLEPGSRVLIPTGIFMALPEGYEAQIRPRSGLALKSGITVLNSPGTVDADYRGEICVILINNGLESFWVEDGERIAQMVITTYTPIIWKEVQEELDSTERIGGFGHTGIK